MSHRVRPRHPRPGTASLELAVVLPLLLLLVAGILEVGRVLNVQIALHNAVRDGAAQAATGRYTNEQVKTLVSQQVKAAGLPTDKLTVTVTNQTSAGTDAAKASKLDALCVEASLPFTQVSWLGTTLLLPSEYALATKSVWLSGKS